MLVSRIFQEGSAYIHMKMNLIILG